ncbi:MAG TPA: ScyD/ScyE family protein [Pyrinomonadaceae bacterium]|nr:ScyD/ScyE family protein [Pyrinomonadaceae bacterium]
MKLHALCILDMNKLCLLLAVLALTVGITQVHAQCPELTSGLQGPLGITQSNRGNLFVSETGTADRDGRVLIVDRNGTVRTLLSGLPSAINDVGEPSGPAGLFPRGETLYVAIGIGDTVRNGPTPGTTIANPDGASSSIFSSILAIRFGDHFSEKKTAGFVLSPEDEQKLANGERVRLSNGGGDRITIWLVANFPDFVSEPLPNLPTNGRGSNPFDLTLVGDRNKHDDGDDRDHDGNRDKDHCDREFLYVSDGGRNLVWQVDVEARAFSILAVFPLVPNPLFGIPMLPGGPFVEAVPTGIAQDNSQLLVTLFRGVPFPPGASTVQQVDLLTGNNSPFISGLKTAIDILPLRKHGDTDYLVLQHASAGPFFGSPGLVQFFEEPGGPPIPVANCLTRPTSMAFVQRRDTLYVTELDGRIVAIPFAP